MWERQSAESATPDEAGKSLAQKLSERTKHYRAALFKARDAEQEARREFEPPINGATVEDEPEEGTPPYRRLRPPYPDTAAAAEAEATVDAQVEIGADGTVGRVEIVRWAGFGLDEAVASTIRQLHFRPAMRNGVPFPVRVLLRYNFRRPPKTN
jgi:TonB family protein